MRCIFQLYLKAFEDFKCEVNLFAPYTCSGQRCCQRLIWKTTLLSNNKKKAIWTTTKSQTIRNEINLHGFKLPPRNSFLMKNFQSLVFNTLYLWSSTIVPADFIVVIHDITLAFYSYDTAIFVKTINGGEQTSLTSFSVFFIQFLLSNMCTQQDYPPKHPVWSCGLKTDDAHLAAHQWKQELFFYGADGAFPTDAEKWAWYGQPKSRMILFSYYLVSLTTLHLPKDIHHSSGCLEDSQILLSSFLNAT